MIVDIQSKVEFFQKFLKQNSKGEISGRLQVIWQDQDSSGRGSGLKIIVDNNTTLFLSYDKFEAIK